MIGLQATTSTRIDGLPYCPLCLGLQTNPAGGVVLRALSSHGMVTFRRVAEPVSGCVAIAVLHWIGATGSVPLWIPEVMCASTIPTRYWADDLASYFCRYTLFRRVPPMLFLEGGMVLATAYVCGWGPLALAVGAILMQMHAKLHGGEVWKPAIVLTILAAAFGQGAIALGWIDTIMPEPLVHNVAGVMLFTSLLTIASLGSRIVESERAEEARAEAIAAVALNEERFRSLVVNSADIVMVLDERGTFLEISPILEGYAESGSMAGIPAERFVHPDDKRTFDDALHAALEAERSGAIFERSVRCELRWQALDRSWRWHEAVLLDLREVESVAGVVVTHRDVTERRALEEQLTQARRLESVGQLASGIAHEINTPIQVIGHNLRFLREAIDCYKENVNVSTSTDDIEFMDAEAPIALDQAIAAVEQVAAIVRAMKAFAQPGITEPVGTDIGDLIRNTVVIATNEISQSARVETEVSALPLVVCMPNEIGQVLLALLVNAAHAIANAGGTSEQPGLINVRAFQEDSELVIGVTDNGTGIPDGVRERIFEPFFTTKPVGSGTGQGLNVAYAALERHHGSITFETEIGKGSTFWIRLPL